MTSTWSHRPSAGSQVSVVHSFPSSQSTPRTEHRVLTDACGADARKTAEVARIKIDDIRVVA